ncbi:MAG: hypothetical protein LBG43_10285 [Treponema sp.]|jgi:predicted HTH transcriptional regulator|nr:hypothetical protein [Treponema sp.]
MEYDWDVILSEGESYTVEFKKNPDKELPAEVCAFANASCGGLYEGRVRYDEIVRDDLPIDEQFNASAYKRYIKAANISEVIDRDAILKNLNCAGIFGGRLLHKYRRLVFSRE